MNDADETAGGGAWFGVLMVAVGSGTLVGLRQIHALSLGENHDPGARALPLALALILMLGGVAEIVAARRRQRRATTLNRDAGATARTGVARPQLIDVGLLLAGLVAYIALLPWLGFSLTTLGFAGGMMARLRVGWRLNLAVTLGLVVAVHVLFVMLFRVQLPRGVLGLPF